MRDAGPPPRPVGRKTRLGRCRSIRRPSVRPSVAPAWQWHDLKSRAIGGMQCAAQVRASIEPLASSEYCNQIRLDFASIVLFQWWPVDIWIFPVTLICIPNGVEYVPLCGFAIHLLSRHFQVMAPFFKSKPETCSKFHPIYGLNHGEGVRVHRWTDSSRKGEWRARSNRSEAEMREEWLKDGFMDGTDRLQEFEETFQVYPKVPRHTFVW